MTAGDWVYCTDYSDKFYLAKIVTDVDGELLSLVFNSSSDEPISLSHVSNSSVNMIKLDKCPVLNLHPNSIKNGHSECKSGYISPDDLGSIRVAIKSSRGFRNDIYWANLNKNEVGNKIYSGDKDIYYTQWELVVEFMNADRLLSLFKYGFSA